MFIHIQLQRSLLERPSNIQEKVVLASDNLLKAFAQGHHVVYVDNNSASLLRKIGGLSKYSASALKRSSQSADLRGLMKKVDLYMELTEDCAHCRAESRGSQRVVVANIAAFEDVIAAQRSSLLGENDNDCRVYCHLGEAWGHARSLRYPLNFSRVGGGGSTTEPMMKQLVREGRIVIAVMDGDIKHPRGSIGSVARKVLEVEGRLEYQRVEAIDARHIECILSDELYLLVFEKGHENRVARNIAGLERIFSDARWRDHADLKNGMTYRKIETLEDDKERAFWLSQAILIFPHACTCSRTAPVSDCQCFVVDGFGDKVPKLVANWLDLYRVNPSQRPQFFRFHAGNLEAIAQAIWCWGCALPPSFA